MSEITTVGLDLAKNVFQVNDFDYLIQALFADQSNTSLKAYVSNSQRAASLAKQKLRVSLQFLGLALKSNRSAMYRSFLY